MLLSATLAPTKFVVAYVPNWIDLPAFAETIDYAKLTHICIAFENPDAEGNLTFNPQNRALLKKAKEAKVKVLISIGGGSAAEDKVLQPRYFDLISGPKRASFASKLGAYLEEHEFDGLDVDIEGPSINDDYGPFIDELDKVLRPKKKLMTAALSQGYGGGRVPKETLLKFDFINIMAYDGKGSWNPNDPGQHSSLEFAKANAQFFLDRGLPKAKAILGVPFYGYGFGNAYRQGNHGYRSIVATYPDAEKVDMIGDTIWYNGIPTIEAKAKYVADEGLGGVMIWSLDDDAPGEKSLLAAIARGLKAGGRD